MQTTILGRVENENGRNALHFGAVDSAGLAKDHGHDGVLVFCATLTVGSNGGFDRQVADYISVDDQEVSSKDGARIEVAHGITDRIGRGADDFDIVERRNFRGPLGLLDVFFNLVGMGAAVDKDFIDTSVGKKFEGVFDQRSVGQGK